MRFLYSRIVQVGGVGTKTVIAMCRISKGVMVSSSGD